MFLDQAISIVLENGLKLEMPRSCTVETVTVHT